MEAFSALPAICAGNSPTTGEFPTRRPVTRIFDVFFDLRLNKRLSKQRCGWWFETPSCLLWRHSKCLGEDPVPSTHYWDRLAKPSRNNTKVTLDICSAANSSLTHFFIPNCYVLAVYDSTSIATGVDNQFFEWIGKWECKYMYGI